MSTQIKENANPGIVLGDVNSGGDWAGITGYTSLLLGTLVSQPAPGPTISPLEIHSVANGSVMSWCHNDNPWVTGEYALMKSKGTQAAPTAVLGDQLGSIGWNGHDGTAYKYSASIVAQANGNFGVWTPSQHVTVLEFQTTPAGTAPIEVFRMGDVNPGVLPQNTSELNLSITGGHVLGFLPGVVGNKPDASVSRLGPASFALGNGLQGDVSGSMKLAVLKNKGFTVAALPAGSDGDVSYATNGLKIGEAPGAGTGVLVYFSNGAWRSISTDQVVSA